MALFSMRGLKVPHRSGDVRPVARSTKRTSLRPLHRARLEALEPRSLLTVTAINVLAINPTEGVPFGSASTPAQVGTFQDNNYIGTDQSSQYSANINWGDGTESAGLGPPTIRFLADLGNGNAKYGVYGYHIYADATTTAKPYSLTITIADNTGPGTLQSQSGPVAVNDVPLQSSFASQTLAATVGVGLTHVTVGQFIDTNPLANAGDFSVQVNWGDGQTTPGPSYLTGARCSSAARASNSLSRRRTSMPARAVFSSRPRSMTTRGHRSPRRAP